MDSEERIAELEAKILKLQASQEELFKQLSTAQRQQWQGRVDDLELQAHLGAMEVNERVQPLLDDLRSKWAEARSHFEGAASTAGGVTDALRSSMESAVRDVRDALLQASQRPKP